MINYETSSDLANAFLIFGSIWWVSCILTNLLIAAFVKSEWDRKGQVSASDIIGIISWVAFSFFPVFNFMIAVIAGGNKLVKGIVAMLSYLDDKIIFRKSKKS